MSLHPLTIATFIGLSFSSASIAENPTSGRTRREFAFALGRIAEHTPGLLGDVQGMAEAEIVGIVGKPDDVRTEYDSGGIHAAQTKEIWCYGTNGHLTFPTLGWIYINEKGRSQYVFGGNGTVIAPKVMQEDRLRILLGQIDQLTRLSGSAFNPLTLIRVVNALQALGKEKALAVIDEYLRVSSEFDSDAREGLFLVLRVLFDVPSDPGYMPTMWVGGPSPASPSDLEMIPRFPIALIEDIPVMLVRGYGLGGKAQPVQEHVEYFRLHGQPRVVLFILEITR